MKTPTIIFILGLVGLMNADFFNQVLSQRSLHEDLASHPEAKAFLANLDDVLDATNSPIVERNLSHRFIDRVAVNPGFRIIHDPTMGKEILYKGPENAFIHLKISEKPNRFTPDFDRPVKLKELVEIRLNTEAHGSKEFRLDLNRAAKGRTNLQPDFVTVGPLHFEYLYFSNIPDHDVQVQSKDVVVYAVDNPIFLVGSADRVEFVFYSDNETSKKLRLEAPNLKSNKILRTMLKN